MIRLKINIENCKSCGLCVKACPKGVLEIGEEINSFGDRYVIAAHEEECIGCAGCAVTCPDMAISIYKEENEA